MMMFVGFLLLLPIVSSIETTILLNGGGCGVATREPGGVVVSHDPIDLAIPISNDINCLFTIQTYRLRQTIRLVFDHLSLVPNDCSQANIEIYEDRFANDSSRLLETICPGTDASTLEYISSGNWLTMKIEAQFDGANPPRVNFSANYASFTEKPCVRPDDETECNLNRCIYNELLCDGVDACGDNTDESTDPPANCNFSSTTTAPTDVTTTSTDGNQNSVKTPLVVILVIAGVCIAAYIFYILMSFAWFSELVYSCFRCVLQYVMRRHRDYKRKKKSSVKVSTLARISPEPVAESS